VLDADSIRDALGKRFVEMDCGAAVCGISGGIAAESDLDRFAQFFLLEVISYIPIAATWSFFSLIFFELSSISEQDFFYRSWYCGHRSGVRRCQVTIALLLRQRRTG
jgi:hypothetical protein